MGSQAGRDRIASSQHRLIALGASACSPVIYFVSTRDPFTDGHNMWRDEDADR